MAVVVPTGVGLVASALRFSTLPELPRPGE